MRHVADPFQDEIHEHNRTPACTVEWDDGLDEDGLDPIEALVADAAAAEPSRMVHEGGEYYAERIIRRAIEQGTLALASRIEARRGETGTGAIGEADESLTAEGGDAPGKST